MVEYLEGLFAYLRPAFSRRAAYAWFVTACMGVILRTDDYGVSSFVRALGLEPGSYLLLLHFFHSQAWSAAGVMERWWEWVARHEAVTWRLNGRLVFTADHTKTPKDGRRMPGVVTLRQDSETASKPSFFRGHHWGCVAVVTHAAERWFATPLWAALHEGMDGWGNLCEQQHPKTVRIVGMAQRLAHAMGHAAYLTLDAYFCAAPVFATAAAVQDGHGQLVHVLTRAKKNIVAYLPPLPKPPNTRGRKPIYGEKLKLYDLFDCCAEQFITATARVYDRTETVRYFTSVLLWKPIKGSLRFFWFETTRGRILLVTSDLELLPLDALDAYCRRVSIETLFNTLKNTLGAMSYHFWSKYLQRVSRRPRKNAHTHQRSSCIAATNNTLAAIEKFVNLHLLTLGALQLLALHFPTRIRQFADCWLRTPPAHIPSEFIVKSAITALWRNNKCGFAKSCITALIRSKQQSPQSDIDFLDTAA